MDQPVEIGFSLGSNLGDRLGYLRAMRDRLRAAAAGALEQSPVYETAPVGVRPEHQHLSYLNAVVIARGPADPEMWRRCAAAIEDALGRVRTADRYAPRTADVDVLFVGAAERADPQLRLPHPRWLERRFVVQPLADLRPRLRLPGDLRPVADVLAALPPEPPGAFRLFARDW